MACYVILVLAGLALGGTVGGVVLTVNILVWQKKEQYKAKLIADEIARRTAVPLPPSPPTKP